MEFHPISEIFPMMNDEEYQSLKSDIKENGLLEPLHVYESKILDGRNRFKACQELGLEPIVKEFIGTNPLGFVISLNLKRRHLNESQRAMVASRLANMRQGERTDLAQNCAKLTQPEAAKLLNVSRRSTQAAKKVQEQGSVELVRAVDSGKITVSEAATLLKHPEDTQREILEKSTTENISVKKASQEIRHEELREKTQSLPEGKYSVILADPPWQYDNTGFTESASSQYPTMPIDEICNLPISDRCTEHTVLFLWATNPLLPEALKVLSEWGFDYKSNMAWIKDKGRGKGWFLKSKHELLLIGVKKDTPHPKERPDSCFEATREKHSKKPKLSYEIIEKMYPGPQDGTFYLELFARKVREGWSSYGNEL